MKKIAFNIKNNLRLNGTEHKFVLRCNLSEHQAKLRLLVYQNDSSRIAD